MNCLHNHLIEETQL